MQLLSHLLNTIPDGVVIDTCIGLHWTAVIIETEGQQRCGLASTLFAGHNHHHSLDIPQAGKLEMLSGGELAGWVHSDNLTQASLGVAAINALLPRDPGSWVESNAEEMIAQHGKGKRVALVGHFPFVPRLRERVGELLVLEQEPEPGDLPAKSAAQILPTADVVAITGMTVANRTLENLLHLCPVQALVILLGPSTPLSPLLFDYGVDILSGAVVTDPLSVLRTITQGGNFRQVHKAGVRLVNMVKPGVRIQGSEQD